MSFGKNWSLIILIITLICDKCLRTLDWCLEMHIRTILWVIDFKNIFSAQKFTFQIVGIFKISYSLIQIFKTSYSLTQILQIFKIFYTLIQILHILKTFYSFIKILQILKTSYSLLVSSLYMRGSSIVKFCN